MLFCLKRTKVKMIHNHPLILESPASFKDPAGKIFMFQNEVYRTVSNSYKDNYNFFIDSGLFKKLCQLNFLVEHIEVNSMEGVEANYKILKPNKIKFISYPYEWTFEQLRDAALLVLKIQKIALECAMTLKDSTAFNVQFTGCKPIWIDTLSFVKLEKDNPWTGYKQFCEHFLAPLALMSYKDLRLKELFKTYLDGIPLDLASKLLPVKSRFNPGILMHIHLHAKSQKQFAEKKVKNNSVKGKFSLAAFNGLIENLKSTVLNLNPPKDTGTWHKYYEGDKLAPGYLVAKLNFLEQCCDEIKPGFVWDLGANAGLMSRINSLKNSFIVALDSSHNSIEKIYKDCKTNNIQNILPLTTDLVNPSPALGWENKERIDIFSRANADLVLALALIHHLVLTNNIPLNKIASWLSELAKSLIIEFVPKSDPNALKLLRSREDIFVDYNMGYFETVFSEQFEIKDKAIIEGTDRVIYFMQRIAG